jgi:hypothetical protein
MGESSVRDRPDTEGQGYLIAGRFVNTLTGAIALAGD